MRSFLLVTFCIIAIVFSLTNLVSVQENKDICSKCFTSGPDHAYCQMANFSPDRPRCDTKYNLEKAGCLEHEIFRPIAEHYVIDDLPLSNTSQKDEDVIQLRPQRIKLRLPPHVPHTIQLQFKQVKDYPVDLYYLMDLSKSMTDDKAKLAELGNLLADNMQRLTSNFRLGFGSFVDKVAMPYVSTVPEKLKAPCNECAAPYGFRNHMPLSTDTPAFTREVAASQISGNLDAPEGGFDAIMQSIVCQQEVGWRSKSRKMLVFTTDAGFHYAGDGKLAGIVTPNDGKCHLENGMYTQSTEQDYPSISQINQKAQEHHVNIIFAATDNQVHIYKKLTPLIEGSSAGKLDNDSSNIVQLIEEQYRGISSEIELKDNATNHVQLTYHSACVNDKRKETNMCKGLKVGSTITFDIDIEVKTCPKNKNEYNQTIQIYPVGLNENLLIDLEIVCDCDCEKPWNIEVDSKLCSDGAGDLVCGICVCDPFRYGKHCECNAKESDPAKDLSSCIKGNETRICSGRGQCSCGQCDCKKRLDDPDARIYGPFCECDNFSCFHHDNKICSGPDHGICECGTCQCNSEWTGPACECRKSVDTCIDPESRKVCAGHGECICGKCKCTQTEDRQYTGEFCEQCPSCPSMCEQYKDCVRCTVHGTGPLTKEECLLCHNSTFNIDKVTDLEKIEKDETLCVFIDDDDCKYQFKYKLVPLDNGEKTLIYALDKKECPTPIPWVLILLLLALLILLLGLLGLLLWKCLTMWKDRREIAKFEKEILTAKWETGENPIFKQATSTFKNPTYKH